MERSKIISTCKELLDAYEKGLLGQTRMPEESHPAFSKMSTDERLMYFTLPMALNYQRDSYNLWEAALKTFEDKTTKWVFDAKAASEAKFEELQKSLTKHKLALQPTKHTQTWQTLCKTIIQFGSLGNLLKEVNYDYLKLKETIQKTHKKEFPYLSGPKIFNYWSYIIQAYGGAKLTNSEFIEIAPDTHVTQCSIILGVISTSEAQILTKEKVSEKWRNALAGSGITPIQMHPPLWFWSRNGFRYKLK